MQGPGGPNGNFTNSLPQFRKRSLEEQSSRAVIAASIGAPIELVTFDKPAKSTLKDITVDIACLRIGSVSSSAPPGGGAPKNGAMGKIPAGGSVLRAAVALAGAMLI